MPETVMQKGIGAAFHINADTKAMRDFFSVLRSAGIQTIDPHDAHITIVDCAETQISVFSERDQLVLNKARAEASTYLATLPYYELHFSPAELRLSVFGRRVGILVAEQEFLLGVRQFVGGIFKDEANIDLSSRNFVSHMTAGLKTRGASSVAKRIKTPRIPRQLHVDGHDVSERVFIEDSSRQRSRQSYTNKRLRLVS